MRKLCKTHSRKENERRTKLREQLQMGGISSIDDIQILLKETIPKNNRTGIRQNIEENILPMYAKGMTPSDIRTHIRDIYGVEVSGTT